MERKLEERKKSPGDKNTCRYAGARRASKLQIIKEETCTDNTRLVATTLLGPKVYPNHLLFDRS